MGRSVYDHARKVGNRADVWKHCCLLRVVEHLLAGHPPGATFRYGETHSGAGELVLGETGEWRQGVGAIDSVPDALAPHPYFRLVDVPVAPGTRYLGSWRLVERHLADQGIEHQIRLCDTSTAVSNLVWEYTVHQPSPTIVFRQLDGFADIEKHPGQHLLFIDPPFKPARHDWRRAGEATELLRERGESYLAWYPIYWPTEPTRLTNAARAPAFELHWAPMGKRPDRALKGCGMLAGGDAAPGLEAAQGELEALAELLGGRLEIRQPG